MTAVILRGRPPLIGGALALPNSWRLGRVLVIARSLQLCGLGDLVIRQ